MFAETQLCFASRDITVIADLSAWLWHHSSGLEKPEVNTGKLRYNKHIEDSYWSTRRARGE